jgi:hypothetical protein
MTSVRSGEKAGWTLGWSGCFLWVLILAVVFLVRGQTAAGGTGILLAAAATGLIVALAPWRHPSTAYWKLMLPLYVAAAASVGWALLAFGPEVLQGEGFPWWTTGLFLLLILSLWNSRCQRWSDGADGPGDRARAG